MKMIVYLLVFAYTVRFLGQHITMLQFKWLQVCQLFLMHYLN